VKHTSINKLTNTKTNFNQMSKEIYEFEKEARFNLTSTIELRRWLEEEVKNYKEAKSKAIKQNKLMDIIILSMQISRREKMDLDTEWKRWWQKSKKYLKKSI
jgi:hypothetical protein